MPTRYEPREIRYKADDGSRCLVRSAKMVSGGYAAIIHWPAGCQDFPDVLRTPTLDGLKSRMEVADVMVKRMHFRPTDRGGKY